MNYTNDSDNDNDNNKINNSKCIPCYTQIPGAAQNLFMNIKKNKKKNFEAAAANDKRKIIYEHI